MLTNKVLSVFSLLLSSGGLGFILLVKAWTSESLPQRKDDMTGKSAGCARPFVYLTQLKPRLCGKR